MGEYYHNCQTDKIVEGANNTTHDIGRTLEDKAGRGKERERHHVTS